MNIAITIFILTCALAGSYLFKTKKRRSALAFTSAGCLAIVVREAIYGGQGIKDITVTVVFGVSGVLTLIALILICLQGNRGE